MTDILLNIHGYERKVEMKTLITEKTIREFANTGEKVFPIDENTLITPSAKDLARNEGIVFRCSSEKQNSSIGTTENVSRASCMIPRENSDLRSEKKVSTEKDRGSEDGLNRLAKHAGREKIVEAVIKALEEKGVLDQIIDK